MSESQAPSPVLVTGGPVMMPEAAPPKLPSNRILVLGQEPEIEDFVAWYLLYLVHGSERVTAFFADVEEAIPPGLLNGEYEAIFLLNHQFDHTVLFVEHTKMLFVVDNHPWCGEPEWNGKKSLWQGSERNHQLVFQEGYNEYARVVTAHETCKGGRRSLSSVLIDALTFVKMGSWWNSQNPVTQSPYVPLALAGKGETRFNNLMAVLHMLDALPAYPNRAAAKLHDKLEALHAGSNIDLWKRPLVGFELLDKFFSQEDLLAKL